MRVFPDYYAALGVRPEASVEEIEHAYRRLVDASTFREVDQPDMSSPAAVRRAEEAYDILTHPEKRQEYDAWYAAWLAGIQEIQEPASPESSRSAHRPCPRCNGSGRSTCLTCEGRGTPGCPGCEGRGEHACVACLGLGTLVGVLTRDVSIPAPLAPDVGSPVPPPRSAPPEGLRRAPVATALLAAALTVLVLYGVRSASVGPAPPARTVQTPDPVPTPPAGRVAPGRTTVSPAPRAAATPARGAPSGALRKPAASGKERPATAVPRAELAPRSRPGPAVAARAPRSGGKSTEQPRPPGRTATAGRAPAPARIPPAPQITAQPPAAGPVPEEPTREQIGEAVLDVVAAWGETLLESNLDGHMSHYADVLERYFTQRNVAWWSIYRDKRRFLTTYPTIVAYRIRNLEIIPVSADLAFAVFDKAWDFRMYDNRRFAGEERQRLKLRQHAGRWRIVAEEELRVYWVVRPDRD